MGERMEFPRRKPLHRLAPQNTNEAICSPGPSRLPPAVLRGGCTELQMGCRGIQGWQWATTAGCSTPALGKLRTCRQMWREHQVCMRQSREMEFDPLSEVFLKSRSFSVRESFPYFQRHGAPWTESVQQSLGDPTQEPPSLKRKKDCACPKCIHPLGGKRAAGGPGAQGWLSQGSGDS